MVNDETIYWQAGFSAGRATKVGDAATASFQREWKSRALLVEAKADRKVADEAYRRGYSEGAKLGYSERAQS